MCKEFIDVENENTSGGDDSCMWILMIVKNILLD